MTVADGIREVCKCGHDKWTHHEGKYDCLGLYCGDCHAYWNEWDKEGPKTEPMPPSSKPSSNDLAAHWTMPALPWPGWP